MMEVLKKYTLFLIFLVLPFFVFAQIKVEGTVNSESNSPLPGIRIGIVEGAGANVDLSGLVQQTYSNEQGQFLLVLENPSTLVLYHKDYKLTLVPIIQDTVLSIQLQKKDDFLAIGLPPKLAPVVSAKAIDLKLPAAFMQILPEHFQRDNEVSITPALNRVSGVLMHTGALNTNRITIRGIGNRSPFSTTKIRAYLDDIPLTSGDGETTIEDIDLSVIDRVKIWKGPTASQYGAGLGGMIHLQTNQKSHRKPTQLSNSFTVGSYGLLRNVSTLNYTNKEEKLNLALNFNTTHSDGYRANNEYDRKSINLLGKYLSGKNGVTTFFGNFTDLKAFIPSSLNRMDFDESPEKAAFTWGQVKGFEDYNKILTGLSHQFKIGDTKKYDLKNTSSIFYSSRDNYESRPFNILDEESRSHGLRSRFTLTPKYKRKNLLPFLSLGVETFRENYKWKIFETNGGVEGDLLSDNKEVRRYTNIFAQHYQHLSEAATLFAGVNLNNTVYEYEDLFGGGMVEEVVPNNFDWLLSPHLGFNYQFKYQWSLFATVSHGFSPPSLSETLTAEGKVNPAIEMEKGWNFEVGSRGYLASRFIYEVTFYTMQIKDLLVARRIAEDQFIGLNAGKTQHNGMELFLEYEALKRNKIKLTSFVSYTFSDFRFKEFVDGDDDFSGNELTGTPPHQLDVGVDFKTQGGLYSHFNFRLVDAFPMRDDNSVYSDRYQVSNWKVGLRKQLFERLELDINAGIQNIFDEKYASMVLINAGSFGGNLPRYYYPGLPRNYFTNLSLRYLLN